LEQVLQLPLSMRHSIFQAEYVILKLYVSGVQSCALPSLESIVEFGAVRSTVQVWVAGEASVLPAASVARTSKVWLPALSAGESRSEERRVGKECMSMR